MDSVIDKNKYLGHKPVAYLICNGSPPTIDIEGNKKEIKAEGLLATCIQHEIDHLNGILFIDHLSKLKKDLIIKNLDLKKNSVLNQDLEPIIEMSLGYLDTLNGGYKGAPKFPTFNLYETILYFYKRKILNSKYSCRTNFKKRN